MLRLITDFHRDDTATAAVEYGLMAVLIAGVIVATVSLLGIQVNNLFVVVEQVLLMAAP